MLCQLPFPVFFDDLSDFIHSFNHEHMGIPKIIFGAVPILKQKGIILCVKGIYAVQQFDKVIVQAAPSDERIPVCIRFDLCSIDIKLFQRDQPFLFQVAHKLMIQFI